jgi:ubiquinone/menaquinone biosynthesis C-methylase UbiE
MRTIAVQDNMSALIRRANQLYHELTRESFERIHRHRFGVQRPFWKEAARIALDENGRASSRYRTIVDLACGSGFVSRTLAEHVTSQDRLIAADLNRGQLRTAGENWEACRPRRANAPDLIRLASDAQTLPLHSESVDFVAVNASLHHMPAPAKVLTEIDRILRPGGFFALGFEPNRTYFRCHALASLGLAVARFHWYASPRQNWRRLRSILPLSTDAMPHAPADEIAVLERMNRTLCDEGLISWPMSGDQILDLVDPHSRGEDGTIGFDPGDLINRFMSAYRTHLLITTDYLGECARFWPTVRTITDAIFRAFVPGHGSLFSWLLQKPEVGL